MHRTDSKKVGQPGGQYGGSGVFVKQFFFFCVQLFAFMFFSAEAEATQNDRNCEYYTYRQMDFQVCIWWAGSRDIVINDVDGTKPWYSAEVPFTLKSCHWRNGACQSRRRYYVNATHAGSNSDDRFFLRHKEYTDEKIEVSLVWKDDNNFERTLEYNYNNNVSEKKKFIGTLLPRNEVNGYLKLVVGNTDQLDHPLGDYEQTFVLNFFNQDQKHPRLIRRISVKATVDQQIFITDLESDIVISGSPDSEGQYSGESPFCVYTNTYYPGSYSLKLESQAGSSSGAFLLRPNNDATDDNNIKYTVEVTDTLLNRTKIYDKPGTRRGFTSYGRSRDCNWLKPNGKIKPQVHTTDIIGKPPGNYSDTLMLTVQPN